MIANLLNKFMQLTKREQRLLLEVLKTEMHKRKRQKMIKPQTYTTIKRAVNKPENVNHLF